MVTNARHLIEPSVELPLVLDKKDAPKIFVVTNAADPLCDDCVELAQALKHE
jgi:hypothetical protein